MIKVGLKLFIFFNLLLGIIYPLFITGLSQTFMNHKANGSIIKGSGSKLIGQKFEGLNYFWGRPSVTDYDTLPSRASNLGPTSKALKAIVDERKKIYGGEAPDELLYASGSGLDPHISPETALFQIGRIAEARGIDRVFLEKLIHRKKENRFLGFLGRPTVNVLEINLALKEEKYDE